jgi:small GTP-binding protein
MGADAVGDGTSSHGVSPAKGEAPQHHLTIEGKLIVVGDSNSGKTSIISAFTRGELNTATRPSIGVAYSKKSITVPGATVNFQVWDTAGQEKFRSINTLYYRNAAAAVLVFDITSRSSFDNIVMWLDEIRRNGASNMVLGLAGNKADLKNTRQVTLEEAKAFADSQQMVYFETSAKTGVGVTELFKAIGEYGWYICPVLAPHATACHGMPEHN